MNKKTFAFITIPALILASTISIAHARDNNQGYDEYASHSEGKHQGKFSKKKAEKKLKYLTKKLALSDQQVADIKALFAEQQSGREATMEKRKALHTAIRELDPNAADYTSALAKVKSEASLAAQDRIDNMVTAKQKISAILTPEQLKKFEEMKSKFGEKRRHHQS